MAVGEGLDSLGLALNAEQLRALRRYCGLVQRWNPVAGLVSARDVPRFFDRHIVDSLSLASLLASRKPLLAAARLGLADFGSGAGLPGIPLAIVLPSIAATLIDRNARKVRFLRRVRDELALSNLQVCQGDIREIPQAQFGLVTARALMPPLMLWRHARPALALGGSLLALDRARRAPPPAAHGGADEFPGGCAERHWVALPRLGAWHGILAVRKH